MNRLSATNESPRRPGRPPNEELQARRRDEILDVAAKVFSEKGYAEGVTQEVADLTGVSKGTIFRYFPSKQELFLAAVHRGLDGLEAWIERQVPVTLPPPEQVPAVIQAYLEYFAVHPQVVELMALERSHFKHRTPTYFSSINAEFECRWDQLVLHLMAIGYYRKMPLERLKNVVGDLVYGTMFSNYVSGRPADPAQQAADIMDVLDFGLLDSPQRTRTATGVTS